METNSLRSYALSRLLTSTSSNNSSSSNSSEIIIQQKINKTNVQNLVDGFHKLNHNEKLLFLINIQHNKKEEELETTTTTRLSSTEKWLLDNFTSDSQTALPKEEVYDFYIKSFGKSMETGKPISTADFGKLMRQVFPEVKARRLGQRGASKYCYANIRKKSEYDLEIPKIITQKIDINEQFLNWGKTSFGTEFENLTQLLNYLKSNKNNNNRKRRNSSRKHNNSLEDTEIKKYLLIDNNTIEMPQLRNLLSNNDGSKKRHCSTIETVNNNLIEETFRSASVPIFDRYDDVNNSVVSGVRSFSADSGYETTSNTPVFNPLLSSVCDNNSTGGENHLFDSVFDLIVESNNHDDEFFDY